MDTIVLFSHQPVCLLLPTDFNYYVFHFSHDIVFQHSIFNPSIKFSSHSLRIMLCFLHLFNIPCS
ncbi:hypothetical protein MtrunA17_Chr7g0264141 [Medicago truncatula]|uniref:Uncharacterized protein n=1 Tax=Medicago truncatula TaxID=3880 RepID=A0A396H7G4_MEDTR|nr:hypothetical protein MtrunA17_Chr7g0264141 [Medicago truncatula]